MTDNLLICKTKNLDSFTIPVKSLFKGNRSDWHPRRKDKNGKTRFVSGENVYLQGTVIGDLLHVEKICCTGEFSATTMDEIYMQAFPDSRGELILATLYEGQEDIWLYKIKDGVVKSKVLEI